MTARNVQKDFSPSQQFQNDTTSCIIIRIIITDCADVTLSVGLISSSNRITALTIIVLSRVQNAAPKNLTEEKNAALFLKDCGTSV